MDDPRLQEARAIPIEEVANRLGLADLKRAGRELVGPCPVCGGRDRFGISPDRGVFNCRQCGGGDAIKLVELIEGCDFKAALSWLVGERDLQIDPAEAARRKAAAQAVADQRAARSAKERQYAIDAANRIWREGLPARGTPVAEYLAARGLPADLCCMPPACLRFHPALRYTVPSQSGQGYDVVHTGPAMLAEICGPDGVMIGVHRTWIDPSRPKGKALIVGSDGAPLQVKKILGSKKGGAIRLAGSKARTMVMGEGIETTLTACAAAGFDAPVYFWAGVDLGNMAGRRVLRGKGMKYAGIPDLDDPDAFVPPHWLRRLVFIQDGDSDPKLTRAKLEAGLRRAKHFNPDLHIQIAHAGAGVDLNDVLMDGHND